mmetsp:Transcript_18576/g.47800  ORF Transcript_18576/g.47800 Transcript_18576/m.47800 type:complete len:329 (-) Transcript_18576:198-1184(-)
MADAELQLQPQRSPAVWSEVAPVPDAGAGEPGLGTTQIDADLRPPLRRSTSERACAKMRRCMDGNARYFDPLAIVESLVAIISGVVVWMGLWDLIDVHIMPDTGSAKLAVVVVSLLAVYANRTLYDKQLLQERAAERERRKGATPADARNANGACGLATVSEPAQATGASAVARSCSTSSAPGDIGDPAGEGSGAHGSDGPPGGVGRGDDGDQQLLSLRGFPGALGLSPVDGKRGMRRLYFDAPPFHAKRFARASFALLAGLTLWIGVWDLLDYHVITTVFTVCAEPVQWQCALVKSVMVLLGLFGLYVTRSLYGEEHVKSAHFQRMS